MLHFFFVPTSPTTQNLVGVGIFGSEVLSAGVLAEGGGPAENLIGVGIGPAENVGTGVLFMGPGGAQSLFGVGIGASETLAAGALSQSGANTLVLIGVAIGAAETLAPGTLVIPGYLPVPPVQDGWLTAAQLASLQGTVIRSLPWLCYVLKLTQTKDAEDDLTDSWNAIVIYNCDVEYMGNVIETPTGAELQSVGAYLVTLPYNAVVLPENRLQINGVTYEIRNDAHNWTDGTAVYVTAEEVR